MATILNADTIVGGAIVTGDASGVLALQSAGVTKLTLNGSGVTLATPLAVASGGTGATTPGASGNVLTSNGTTWTSALPAGDVTLAGVQTFTGTKTFTGTSSTLAIVLNDSAEVVTVSATAATGTINYDVTTQSVLYFTSNSSGNFTVNFRASSGTSLNTAMATGQSISTAFFVTNGATAYYNTVVQVDGTTITPKFQGGTAYSAGNANAVDIYTYTIIKTGAATFSVFASQTKFA